MEKLPELDKIIQEYGAIFHKICGIYTSTKDDYEDLFQEILYQVWRSLKSFRGDSKLSSWLYRIALNTAIGQIRTRKKWTHEQPIEESQYNFAETDDGAKQERIQSLYRSIRRLPEADRALIMLFLDEKSYQEIADITGLTVSNVGVKLNRIKKVLKEIINEG